MVSNMDVMDSAMTHFALHRHPSLLVLSTPHLSHLTQLLFTWFSFSTSFSSMKSRWSHTPLSLKLFNPFSVAPLFPFSLVDARSS